MRKLLGILLLLLVLAPTPASAALPDWYITVPSSESVSGTNERWEVYCTWRIQGQMCGEVRTEDPYCGTSSQQFRAVIYEHENFHGNRTVLCRQQKNFCYVPMDLGPSNMGCAIGCCNNANDKVSSIAVGDIEAGGACLRIFDNTEFNTNGGESWLFEGQTYANVALIPGTINNDRASSLKRVFASNCP